MRKKRGANSMESKKTPDYDLLIVGAGPAGYVAAIRAGQVGLKTALVERDRVGGMCLNWGCIPTKAMLESARLLERVRQAKQFGIDGVNEAKLKFNWGAARDRADRVVRRLAGGVEAYLARYGVETIRGEAELVAPTAVRVGQRLIEAGHVFLATGSRPAPLPAAVPPELALEIDGLFALRELPASVAVVGQGPNALELALLLKMAGSVVTLVSPAAALLSQADPYLSNYALNRLRHQGVRVIMEAVPTGSTAGGILVGDERILCERVLNASRRRAVIPKVGFELTLDDGFVFTDDYLQAGHPNLFAVGDVNGRSDLAHAASAQGLHAVNAVKGVRWKLEGRRYPLNIYAFPEIAQVGLTEPEIQARGIDYRINEYPLAANGKALAEGQAEGFVRLLSEKRYGEVLGVQIVAAHASDMIAEAAAIIQAEGTVHDVARIVHAHPTVSEVFLEAGLAALGQPLHE
jgi:dihydrolipoamide dehydrogenase